MYSQLIVWHHGAQTLPQSHHQECEKTMHTRLRLIILALAGTLFAAGAKADCNRPSTDYERQDCAFKADRDFRRGNTEVDQAAQRYQESLKRNADEGGQQTQRPTITTPADKWWQEAQETMRKNREREEADKATEYYKRVAAREEAYKNARTFFNLARNSEKSGNDKLAETYYREAEKQMALAEYDHPHDYALALESLGESLRRQGRYDEAVPLLTKALSKRERLQGKEHPDLVDVLISLGQTYTALGRYIDAEPALLKALSIREKRYGKTDEQAAFPHTDLGALYARQKRYDDAESHYQAALSIRSERLGEEHANTIKAMKRLATVYRDAGMDKKADTLDKRIREASKDPQYATQPSRPTEEENLTRAIDLGNQGKALYEAGKYQEAVAIFRDALKLRQGIANNPSRNKEPLEINFFNLGMSLLSAKEYAEADSMLKQALALRDNEPALKPKLAFFGSAEERLMRNLDALAALYTRQQKHYQAEPYLRRIVELQEKTRGAEHLETLASLKALAENLSAQGSDKEAALNWQRTVALAEKLPAAQNQLPDLREKLLTAYNRSGAFPKEAEALEIQVDWEKPWIRLAQAANAAYKARQYEEAISQGQKALDFAQKHSGASENRVGISQNNLAVYYRATKQYVQAEALYKKSLDTYTRVSGADSPSLILPLRDLCSLYDLQRRFDEAEPLYRRLLVLQEKRHGLEHVDVAKTLSKLARLLDRKSQYAEAEPLFARALAIVDKRGQTDDDESLLLEILTGLARAYRNTGHDDEARRVDQRYEKLREKIMKGDLSEPFQQGGHLKLALSS